MLLKATLEVLLDIEALRKLTQSLAMLDAIMSPEWEYRYYSFNSKCEIVAQLNDEITLESLTADIEQIAYPNPIGPSSVT